MAVGEATQQQGFEGVHQAKRWLDRTTRARISWDAYAYPEQVKLPPLAGPVRGFDLAGELLDEDGISVAPLFVEVKHYSTEGGQGTKYLRYLANCYSITARACHDGMDKKTEFMWLTWHPFSIGDWPNLCSTSLIKKALDVHADEVLGGHAVDDELCDEVANRLWVVVLGGRHDQLMMGKWLMGRVRNLYEERSGS